MKRILSIFVFFIFPAIVSFLVALIFRSKAQLNGLIENALFSSMFILFSVFITRQKYRTWFLCCGVILNTTIIFCETAYYYLYGYNISESTIYILMETHRAEASEFLSVFFDKNILLFSIIFFSPLIIICKNIMQKTTEELKFLSKTKFVVLFFMIIIMAGIIFTGLKRQSLPLTTFTSIYNYKKTVSKLDQVTQNKDGGTFTGVRSVNNYDKATYVVIIGESSTRNHFGLYGYNRQTTPLLNEIKNELYIYNNVIAPHTTTIQVLIKALTPGNFENPDRSTSGTLMQLMNKAGYKTYWISNQKPFGTYESITSKLSKTATYRMFLDHPSAKSTLSFDENLLPPFKNVLEDKADKKMIVIHLLGAHAEYEKRYPDKFELFTDHPDSKYNNENAYKVINSYDNAIAYTDYIIRQIIEYVRKTDDRAFVLYFSDHGEDIYESRNMAFHSESEGTKPMYDIPFFLWVSEKYKNSQPKNIVFDPDRKYMTDDLMYSIANLSGIDFKENEPGRSIFDKNFKDRIRRIYNNYDYDVILNHPQDR